MGGSAEELGYGSVWTNDAPPGDGLEMALAMLAATTDLRVGVGAVPIDRRPPAEIARRLDGAGAPLERLTLILGTGASTSIEAMRAAVAELRAALGSQICIGVAAMGPRMCRLGGQVADVVMLNWMNPERIVWAREQVRRGAAGRQAGLGGPEPEVASYIRVALGQGAALRVGAEAARYGQMPAYAANFAAMGVASVGIAASDPAQAAGMLQPYLEVLDDAIVRPIVSVPTTAQPELNEVFETLGVLMEVASLFAPNAADASVGTATEPEEG